MAKDRQMCQGATDCPRLFNHGVSIETYYPLALIFFFKNILKVFFRSLDEIESQDINDTYPRLC